MEIPGEEGGTDEELARKTLPGHYVGSRLLTERQD